MLNNIVPKGKQREVLALSAKGHVVVLGTAGSGKTTIAALLEIPELKQKTFGKALQLIQAILLGNEPAAISKKFRIDVGVVNILIKYLR